MRNLDLFTEPELPVPDIKLNQFYICCEIAKQINEELIEYCYSCRGRCCQSFGMGVA